MVKVLQDNGCISWTLTPPVEYTAGEELTLDLSIVAPEAGNYYIAGALYTTDLDYIYGTLFGVFIPPGTDYGIVSVEYATAWTMDEEEAKTVPCRLILERSDVVLGLFLFKMEGDAPVFGIDEEKGSVSGRLTSPIPPTPPLALGELIGLVVVVGIVGYGMNQVLRSK